MAKLLANVTQKIFPLADDPCLGRARQSCLKILGLSLVLPLSFRAALFRCMKQKL